MGARVYATAADYAAWLGDPQATVSTRALLRASLLVEAATVGSLYRTDAAGLPLDVAVAEAMRDAVCAQIEAWVRDGDETGAGVPEVTSASIGGVSFTVTPGTVTGLAAGALDDLARLILEQAGLLTSYLWVT